MTTASAPAGVRVDQNAARKTAQNRERWASARTYISAAVILIWCLAPAYWMVVTAFREVGFTYDTTPWPTHVTLDNFLTAFDTSFGNKFGQALLNSIIIGVTVTVVSLVIGVFAAYALARLNFRFKYLVLGFILGASMFPGVALITPLFQLFTNIGWMGTYQALIIPNISFVLPLTVYTLTSFFREMPWELEESARVDGCTQGQAFRKVIMPLAAPAIFTTAILAFISSWNEFLIASQLSNERTQPVTVAIASFAGAQPNQIPYTAIMAAGTIVTIPLVILVLVFQRKIVAGLTAGAVK
ncbi:carbohydrate ABC transporter permease [Pseudarthrobacter chlorophenolicus]|uniref:Binding-protein-dependent transport systems inner membrane component n=1 Tax=Pseudarthrobacter chlorophenolicus (strain ATCC 700700 / DSM 12829 / CIP 107037 / JCM 12360 / KCTC 9906 / NCIMB 13794 / A6) TaxID=452863 RepID=B8HBD8_PSECP|nr:carbohydrate ABC transporter permease [Pseudarthrobacter chlorophenolicus]ACL38623.1 binding-protein-dependent transport systems inner membrane component [Pseudarthrobacter chlorophenolicus A6]SDQ45137.1 carbohydrate ABC transporter membrane protein 2, CUT1 family [Pseudarthrobacter chlorophenolicus]